MNRGKTDTTLGCPIGMSLVVGCDSESGDHGHSRYRLQVPVEYCDYCHRTACAVRAQSWCDCQTSLLLHLGGQVTSYPRRWTPTVHFVHAIAGLSCAPADRETKCTAELFLE